MTTLPEALSLIAGPARDPVPLIAEVREREPLYRVADFDAWLVTRHDDVRLLFTDSRMSPDPSAYALYEPPTEASAARWLSAIAFRATPANPESLGRRLVSSALTPRAVERTKHRIQEVVEEFATPLRLRNDVVDLFGEFTAPVSSTVIGRVLGIPSRGEDEIRFRKLAGIAARAIRPFLSPDKRRETERAGVEIAEYVFGLIETRRHDLREGMISDLLSAAGANGRSTTEDVVRIVGALVSIGTGTTGVAAARALRSLLLQPDQLDLVRRDRALLPNAVEELLRYDSGLNLMPRYPLEDFELRGRTLRKGQLVLLSLIGANRDPRVFSDPDRLDLRRDTSEALAFGYGSHYCIGANVARAALHLMLDAALDFLPPRARLLEDQIRWNSKGLISQIKSLPVDFRSAGDQPSLASSAGV